MAGWEDELAGLLGELGVIQDDAKPRSRPTQLREIAWCDDNEERQRAQHADRRFWQATDADAEEGDEYGDPGLMGRQVASIAAQVAQLIRHGSLGSALKEDVMVVFQALQRRAQVTQQAAASDTARLECAVAMLHFCHLVLQLSESASSGQ